MPRKIFVLEHPDARITAAAWPESQAVALNNLADSLKSVTPADGACLVGTRTSGSGEAIADGLRGAFGAFTSIKFGRPEDATRFTPRLRFLVDPQRTTGVKCCLKEGSEIYSDAIYRATGLGTGVDRVHPLLQSSLAPVRALMALASAHALLFLGIASLPSQGSNTTGEKVDLQVGIDDGAVAVTVRFALDFEKFAAFRGHPLLALPRNSAHLFEIRYLHDAGQLEVLCLFFRAEAPEWPIEAEGFTPTVPLEDNDVVKKYVFRPFDQVKSAEGKSAAKSGFKKKFSEMAAESSPVQAPSAPSPKVVAPSGPTITPAASLDGRDARNNQRLEAELAAAAKRELELLSAIELLKSANGEHERKIEKLEELLAEASSADGTASPGGAVSFRITMLEKQVEEQKRQNRELSKKITALVERAAEKKVA